MKTAFLFPGQGSQFVGMGADLFEAFPEARSRFDEADRVLGFPLSGFLFGTAGEASPDDALRQTEITQPALYVHSLAAFAVLQSLGVAPDMVAGHSLGEYSALAASGAISFEDGLRAVRLRGQSMAEAGRRRPGAMAAVLGLDDEIVIQACLEASREGVVQAANFNAPGQVVISGEPPAVNRAMERAKERGARRVVPLPVSGAFHSPLMEHARDGLAGALQHLDIQPPRCPVYLNVTAEPTTDPEEIRQRLLEQLLAPVRWAQILRRQHADGAFRFIEVGAGNVLAGLARRTLGREIETHTAGTASELAGLREQIGQISG
jgi:[acyl-carrier-protein] S-malonyltransferase